MKTILWIVVALVIGVHLIAAPGNWFNDARLAPLFMLKAGFSPYPAGIDAGPMANLLYPPLNFLAYAPALLFHTPVAVVLCAVMLVVFFIYLPVWLVLWGSPDMALLLAGFVLWAQLSDVLSNVYLVHADAPAIFLAALACICVVRAIMQEDRAASWALAAGFFAAMAPWAKQLAAPVALIPFLVFLLIRSRKAWLLYCASFAVTEVAALSLFHRWFGLQNIYFWIITVPSHHAWKGRWSTVLPEANGLLVRENIMWLAILLSFTTAIPAVFKTGGARAVLRQEPWIVFLGAGLLLWPTSMLGYVKMGGAANNLMFASYFIVLAVLLKARDLLSRPQGAPARVFVFALLACLAFPVGIDLAKDALSPKRLLTEDLSVVYAYSKKHPGEVYFPMFCVSTYLANGQMHHFEFGIEDREGAGIVISAPRFWAYVPPQTRYVAFKGTVPSSTLLRMGASPQSVALPELPGWSVRAVRSGIIASPP